MEDSTYFAVLLKPHRLDSFQALPARKRAGNRSSKIVADIDVGAEIPFSAAFRLRAGPARGVKRAAPRVNVFRPA